MPRQTECGMTPEQHIGKRERGDDRRLAIAAAARELIAQKGLEGLRTRDIAERVGINIATLHYHVPSKAALVTLVAESIRLDFRNQAARNSRDGKTALERLRLEFADFRETTNERPDLVVVLTVLTEKARRDPDVNAVMRPMHDYWRDQFVDIFTRGAADGSFRANLDPVSAAHIVTGALSDHWRRWFSDDTALDGLFAELERAFNASPAASKDRH